jgi:hypothetical protein
MPKFKSIKIQRIYKGKLDGEHWQVLAPDGQVLIDQLLTKGLAEQSVEFMNRHCLPIIEGQRKQFDGLIKAAGAILATIDEYGVMTMSHHLGEITNLRVAYDDVVEIFGMEIEDEHLQSKRPA